MQVKKYKRRAKKSQATVVDVGTQVDYIATTSAATQIELVEKLFEDREYALIAKT